MLQIITGKFFTREQIQETVHTGVLFTNAAMYGSIETCIGTLEHGVQVTGPQSLVYRVTERLESHTPDGQPSILASTGGREIVSDFASVAGFALGVLVTPDSEIARRLVGGQSSTTRSRLTSLVPRVFDPGVDVTPADQDRLITLAQDLVDLPRGAFLASMRAIRRYTLGLERLGDEPDLAYSLLVASIESLAQEFDAFVPTWGDIAQQRREPVDAALRGAPEDVVARVRGAILTTEHAALARRFRDFAIANVAPSFFREEALGSPKPAQRAELAPALTQAYKLRSKYIHTLRELPREMQVAVPMWDVTTINGPVLTFRGLARLARHVIFQFISRHPKVAREPLNYWQELPNLIWLQPANRYWIWNAENYSARTAHRYLSGFLEDLAAVFQRVPDAAVTDMREVLAKIERTVPGLARPAQRLPMVTLHFLFHQVYGVAPEHHERSVHFLERYLTLFDAPSPESMIAHVALNQETGWTAAQFQDAWTAYQAQRFRRDALVLPRLFEAASLLTLAELHRRAADADGTRTAIAAAVEAMPGVEQMLELERDRAEGRMEEVIEWRAVLLRPTTAQAEPQ